MEQKADLHELLNEISEEGFDSVMVDLSEFIDFLYNEGYDGIAEFIADKYQDEEDESVM
jgi:ferritin